MHPEYILFHSFPLIILSMMTSLYLSLAEAVASAAQAAAPVAAPVATQAAEVAAPTGTNWLGFLGHFHPLLLHLPIGLITGVIFLELAALWRAYHHGKRSGKVEWFEESRPYVGLATWLLAISGVVAAFVGYFWRLNEFEPPSEELHNHQVLGFWMAGCCVLAAILHALAVRLRSRGVLWTFRVVLMAAAIMLAPLGHLGGQMVHGDTFLSKYAPAWLPQPIKDLLGKKKAEPVAAKDESAFGVVIKPIMDARCVSCHGPENKKAGLQLHDMAGFLKGSVDSDGPVFVPGKPDDSLLLTVMHSPVDEDGHMPPKNKPQPSADELAAIKWWIASGAKFDGTFDLAGAPEEVKRVVANPPKAAGPAEPVKEVVSSVPAVDIAAVSALRAKQVAVQPLAQGSNLLMVDFTAPSANTTDAELALLAPLSGNIAQLNLGRSKITDAGLDAVAKLAALETLDVRATGVTDAGLGKLAGLKKLTSLNLTGTGITDAGLDKVAALAALEKIYLWNSKTTPEGVAKLKTALPKAMIDDGTTPPAAVLPDPNAPINTVCPVSGKPVNLKITSTFEGKTLAFADAASKATFDAALAKPEEAKPEVKPEVKSEVKPEAKPAAPVAAAKPVNTVCPVSGKPVDPAHTLVFEGKVVGFCCGNCPKAFQADPAKYKANIK